ncbi:MAG TPA: sulfotransferase [Rhodanobacteraceae bacterium]|nr:sulfotransferase [Rhodanobacteraceae bacterium]
MSHSSERHWQRGNAYLAQRQLAAARIELDALRSLAPDDWRCGLLAARLAWHADRPRDAAGLALQAVELLPAQVDAVCEAVQTLLLTGETQAARRIFGELAWVAADPDTLARGVDFAHRFGLHARALAGLDRLLATYPDDGPLHCQRGLQLEYLGRLDGAVAEYAACLALAPAYGQAAYQWARLHRSVDRAHLDAAIERGLRAAAPGSRDQADLEFARYHVLEDAGDSSAAWRALVQANAIMHAHTGAVTARQLRGLAQFDAWIAGHALPVAGAAPLAPRPIFVLGMPRSGTTVLERMLGNHSGVATAGELPDFGQQLAYVADTASTYSDAFYARLPTLDFGALGRRYVAQTGWRAQGRPWFTDKQPGNWMLAGLIHAALPQARILHVVRDPVDVCFSNWRARFITFPWSYDLATLAAYHAIYRRLMRRWQALYPGSILDVPYADLVRQPEATLRRVFGFCGLAWEPGCEDLIRNANPVATLSAAAVREPLHARALGQWQRYAVQLEPLRDRLAAEA